MPYNYTKYLSGLLGTVVEAPADPSVTNIEGSVYLGKKYKNTLTGVTWTLVGIDDTGYTWISDENPMRIKSYTSVPPAQNELFKIPKGAIFNDMLEYVDGESNWKQILLDTKPAESDDASKYYSAGDIVRANNKEYKCFDATVGSAIWGEVINAEPDSSYDSDAGYSVGDYLYSVTKGAFYKCSDNTNGAAVWEAIGLGTGSGASEEAGKVKVNSSDTADYLQGKISSSDTMDVLIVNTDNTKSLQLSAKASSALWNANKIVGKDIDTSAIDDKNRVLMYNPATDKLEYSLLPSCEDGNIIVPTYTRVVSSLTAEDIEQMITNRIAQVQAGLSTEPIRYICLEPNINVPINKGVIDYVRGNSLEVSDKGGTNGDLFFAGESGYNKLVIFNKDGTVLKEYENDDWGVENNIAGVTRNGKRFFTDRGIFDIDANDNLVKTSSFNDYYNTDNGLYCCNSCGNKVINTYTKKVYELDEGGTWNEVNQLKGTPAYESMSFSTYGFRYAVCAKDKNVYVGSFDSDFNWTTITQLDVSNDLANNIRHCSISSDLNVIYLNDGSLYVYIKQDDGTYQKSFKIRPNNSNTRPYATICITGENKELRIVGGNSHSYFYKINMTPSMYCGANKTYTEDNTFDVSSYLNGEKLTAVTRYFSQPLGNFFIGTDAGKVLKIDTINDTSTQVADVGEKILSLACNKNGSFLAMNYGADGSNKVRKYDINNNSLSDEIVYSTSDYDYALNNTLFVKDNGDTYLTLHSTDSNNNTSVTQCMSGNQDCASIDTTSDNEGSIFLTSNRRITINLDYDSDTNKTTVNLVDLVTNDTGGIVLDDEYNIVNVSNDNLMFLQIAGQTNAEAFCIEDLNNIIKVAGSIPLFTIDTLLQKQFTAEYDKSQKTITRTKDENTIQTFSLLI